VFGRSPEAMTGSYLNWLDCIVAEDRELVIAALEQLGRTSETVVCEYRLLPLHSDAEAPADRWVRDAMTPHYTEDGSLDGWEGFVEDITERRKLSHDLRRTNAMLQALVANLPAGVFFIHGPMGFTLLANARARELLGQREDGSVPLSQLSRVYRFFRPDGSEYPADELPVAKALRQGVRCTANDVVIHRPDGRKIPLVTWAAPVHFGEEGKLGAAVWVLEDLTPIQRAQAAQRESEALLRTVIDTMAEAVLVQDGAGIVLECNPAACRILGIPQYQLLGRSSLAPPTGLLSQDGQPLSVDDGPDMQALRTGQSVRAVVGYVPDEQATPRWLLVDALPLPSISSSTGTPRRARLVTTITDVTGHVITPSELAKTT
jgi:PAS domain-containing protein